LGLIALSGNIVTHRSIHQQSKNWKKKKQKKKQKQKKKDTTTNISVRANSWFENTPSSKIAFLIIAQLARGNKVKEKST
jgi:hypothetical protein